ncbi:MAG: tetratricopeptide repeat protein [Pirellulaceae bacterium]|nr:tetratricopeptide repeat protein [Pirellulaceae bacterium]
MSDTFEPNAEPSQHLPGQSPHGTNLSPLLLGCGALFLALFALGILAVVTVVIVAVHPDSAQNDGRSVTAAQPRPTWAMAEEMVSAQSAQPSRSPRTPAQRLASARRAIENGRQALAANPNDAGVLNNLAWAYATAPEGLRDGDQAVDLAERAVSFEPGNQNHINTLGTAYYRAGQYDKAISTLEGNAAGRTDASVGFDLYPLAMSYFALEQKDKARETYERAAEFHRRNEDRLSSNHWQEMHEFRIEAATLLLGEAPKQIFDRAQTMARKGEWEQAAAQFAKGLDVYKDDHWHWYQSAALQAYLSQSDEYGNHCRKMLELFGDTEDPFIAERTAKLCFLLPDAAPDDPRPAKLAEEAVGMRSDNSWFALASAIAKYRAGQFQESLDRLRIAQVRSGDQTYCNVLIELFRAMSQHQLGEQNAARKSLGKAIDLLNSNVPTPIDDVVDYGPSWHDRLISQIILREAKALIMTEDSAPVEPGGESVSETPQ